MFIGHFVFVFFWVYFFFWLWSFYHLSARYHELITCNRNNIFQRVSRPRILIHFLTQIKSIYFYSSHYGDCWNCWSFCSSLLLSPGISFWPQGRICGFLTNLLVFLNCYHCASFLSFMRLHLLLSKCYQFFVSCFSPFLAPCPSLGGLPVHVGIVGVVALAGGLPTITGAI